MSAIGGAWMPLNIMPTLVRQLARGTLTFWSIDAFQASFWYSKHWTDPVVLTDLAVLLGVAAGLSALAAWLFGRRYRPT
jgi:ABC-type multidrug transport system permease subunit